MPKFFEAGVKQVEIQRGKIRTRRRVRQLISMKLIVSIILDGLCGLALKKIKTWISVEKIFIKKERN